MSVFGLPMSHDRTELEADAEEPYNNKICFIGDGINDAMGLAAAHVGVAIGANGAALAATAGDIVILNDNLNNIPMTLDLCHVAYAVILQNCIFAVGIKLLAVLFAVLGR
jgi:Zn2+/Cd2+-exporting ATPase